MKASFIVVLTITLFVLVGCGSGSSTDTTDYNWKSGTQGVTLAFGQNTPPAQVFAGERYSLVLELRNRGAFPEDGSDYLDVDLYFSGFDPQLIGLPDRDYITIEGSKSQTNPEGGLEFYETDFDVDLWRDADSLPQDIRVTACYYYQTFAPLDLCVDPDPTRNDDDTCRTTGASGAGGQAAPIAVTSVQQQNLKGKVQVTIKVSNVGGGSVFTDTDCIRPERSRENTVRLLGVFIGGDEMDCTPQDTVRMVNGVGTITCSLDRLDETRPSYLTTLGVQLEYGYKQFVNQRVTIRNIQ